MDEIENRIEYSNKVLASLRDTLQRDLSQYEKDITVVATGSFGRKEASSESDLDWFVVSSKKLEERVEKTILNTISHYVNKFVNNNHGDTKTFGEVVDRSHLLENFGGDKEQNQDLTRRMLYLLESTHLLNENLHLEIKKSILEKYIKNSVSDSSINRFMLNDTIRYYRTICTDYEYKVHEDGKSIGVRKIKLRFSRKLLYFSGLITIASTASLSRDKKIEETLFLLDKTPLERTIEILGDDSTRCLRDYYSKFLEEISKREVREALDNFDSANRESKKEYKDLRNLSQHFNWELEKCFSIQFPPSHPIHPSMIF
ncbi:nucleotidyltransferase domain-containing protein [Salinivibrio kushneri]|uniref:nucleotidyltransferase domain-containing protein n=1 Tax=Salinivibrio kushneri TaxID=1908198 RepID=UPI000988309A|nr:nucleotidyltransferase domain-containing protein [Salinivibrio kushneri]OOE54252.1 hypothetical protein BZG12_07040 [Salinivibrio kushneri]